MSNAANAALAEPWKDLWNGDLSGSDTSFTATEIVLPGLVEPDGLQVRRRTLAAPGPGRVLLIMEATGVSFAEQQMRRGKYWDQPPFPFVPGYDVVGLVAAAGDGVDTSMVGRRYAAVTKTGGWASAMVLAAGDLVAVPDGLGSAEAETVVVNGVTAWQMLHRQARARRGQVVLVLGANGGVGSTLIQLARHAGIRVIGAASQRHLDAVRALGAEPVDYAADDFLARVRALAPGGVDAVFDNIGGPGLADSFGLVASGGTLVSYGSAVTKNDRGSKRLPGLLLTARTTWWNLLPNGRRALFYNFWAGKRHKTEFQGRLREDLTQVFTLLADGTLTAHVAARMLLSDAATALQLAESRTVFGKVVLVPDPAGKA